MISYRPTPELAAGRTGFRAALGAMMLAAVLGTAAFAPTGVVATTTVTATTTGTSAATTTGTGNTTTTGTSTSVPSGPAVVRREDDGGAPDEGFPAHPLQA